VTCRSLGNRRRAILVPICSKDPDRLQRRAKRPAVPRRAAANAQPRDAISEPAPTPASPGSMTAPPSPSYEREPMRSPAETPPRAFIARSVRTLLDTLAWAKQALFSDGRAAPELREQGLKHAAQASRRPVLLTTAGETMRAGKAAVGRWWERLVVFPLRALARPFVGLGANLLARWKTSENAAHRTPSD
jgi:hypothetical protein